MNIRKKIKILVVDDEPFMLEALVIKLETKGFNVITAKDGGQGFKIALEERPDLILLDIAMPKVDGLTMLKKLRKDIWGETVKVIILTNLNSDQKKAEAVEGKMHGYLIKSDWTLQGIVRKIEYRLGINS